MHTLQIVQILVMRKIFLFIIQPILKSFSRLIKSFEQKHILSFEHSQRPFEFVVSVVSFWLRGNRAEEKRRPIMTVGGTRHIHGGPKM